MPLHPVIKHVAAKVARATTPRSDIPAVWRSQALTVDREVTRSYMKPAPDCFVRDVEILCANKAPLRIRLYSPRHQRPAGALLHFFGGAFRQGGVDYPSTDITNRTRAARSGILVAAVDYALSPESRFPEPIDQGLAALEWLASNSATLGFPAGNVAIGGLSAGGNIAAGVALAARNYPIPNLLFQLLEVPVLDLTGEHFLGEVAVGLGQNWHSIKHDLIEMGLLYLRGANPTDPHASPLLAPQVGGLPPTHVFTAEYDVFRGDGSAFVDRLRASGIPAQEYRYAGMTHDSHFYDLALPQARAWRRDVERLLYTQFRS